MVSAVSLLFSNVLHLDLSDVTMWARFDQGARDVKNFPPNMFSIIHSLLMIQVLSDCKCFLCGEEQQIKENNWLDWEQEHTDIYRTYHHHTFRRSRNFHKYIANILMFPECTAWFNWSRGLWLEYCVSTARYIYGPILSRNRERNVPILWRHEERLTGIFWLAQIKLPSAL